MVGDEGSAAVAFGPGPVAIDCSVSASSDTSVVDFWEPVPCQSAWVRYHVLERRELYEPTSAGNGPELDLLSDYRCTYFTFSDGSFDAKQDSW